MERINNPRLEGRLIIAPIIVHRLSMEILSHQLGLGMKHPSYLFVYPPYYGDIARENKIKATFEQSDAAEVDFFFFFTDEIIKFSERIICVHYSHAASL